MKSPLRYQATDADCGKTSLVNAFMYLYDRSEIPPQVIDYVTRVTGDCNLAVNGYFRGTSMHSLAFMAAWCNDYLVKAGFPIHCLAIRGDLVSMDEDSPLVQGLRTGAVAVCGLRLIYDHYVLMTGIDDESVYLFDPSYDTYPPTRFPIPDEGVRYDFFIGEAEKNLVRRVYDDTSIDPLLYKATFADGTTKITEVMQDWYNALAAANGKTAG